MDNPRAHHKMEHRLARLAYPVSRKWFAGRGQFTSRMEAKHGSFGFDFWGIYDEVKRYESIMYTMGDGRKATVSFSGIGNQTKVIEIFEAETENSVELQREGWQAIFNSFK